MRLESKKYLFDARQAALRIHQFIQGKGIADYQREALLRSAVERQREFVGEALTRLAKVDPACAGRIGEHRRIIAFRNILVHAYAEVDDQVIWNVVELKLPTLLRDVEALLQEPEEE